MLSINTNLSSLIAQNSLKSSSYKLDRTIERMTTGCKINHAKDNAANYSIATNMTTKIGAYQVAEDNALQGLDMLMTANESLSLISDKLVRLRALATQASNGTYGVQSLEAINSEANAHLQEIERLYSTAEYNGISLLNQRINCPNDVGLTKDLTPMYNGFIKNPKDYTDDQISVMKKLSEVVVTDTITNGQYSISTPDELAQLAEMVNNNKVTGGEFVLAKDIDLSAYVNGEGWIPIGKDESCRFKAVFNGNGNKITNLYINRPDAPYQGLFGYTSSDIKNLAIEDCDIIGGEQTGAISGSSRYDYVVDNCYSSGNVIGDGKVGGLIGYVYSTDVLNCYSNCDVSSLSDYATGGLIGHTQTNALVENCFSTGSVKGYNSCGGLIGDVYVGIVRNCYSTSNVEAREAGGLLGSAYSLNLENCYSSGDVQGGITAGLITSAQTSLNMKNCYTTSNVTGSQNYCAGVIAICSITSESNVENIYCYGDLNLTKNSAGFIGRLVNRASTLNIDNVNIYSKMKFSEKNRGNACFIAINENTTDESSFGSLVIKNSNVTSVEGLEFISGSYKLVGSGFQKIDYDLSDALAGLSNINEKCQNIILQVGIYPNGASSIDLNCKINFQDLNLLNNLKAYGISSSKLLDIIDDFANVVAEKQVVIGAAQNRLESALDEISTQYENLVSSRSTLRDVDMAEASSDYVRQQILQQASATLMSTANQSPSIALQLI